MILYVKKRNDSLNILLLQTNSLCFLQECSDGYFRVQTGDLLGKCVPCDCNQHSATCDKETGRCTVSELGIAASWQMAINNFGYQKTFILEDKISYHLLVLAVFFASVCMLITRE